MFLAKLKKLRILRSLYEASPRLRWGYHFVYALLGSIIHRLPKGKLFIIGVTGTKGKTTVLELMNAVLEAHVGKRETALLSSTTMKIGEERKKNVTENSMPGRFFIQRFLKQAIQAGCRYALIEVTSEGVVQSRHRFIPWDAGFIINIHPEHIESHGSFEKYRDAKLSFLRYAWECGAKIFINENDREAAFFEDALREARPVLYSRGNLGSEFAVPALFPTDFNKDNVMAAVALARDLGIDEEAVAEGFQNFDGVPGRMEFVQVEPFAVLVDYAHTPDSLEAVYRSLEGHMAHGKSKKNKGKSSGRLVCVLGSAGGGRDTWKRPKMGEIAARHCDKIFLTDEDSYDEDPAEILEQIESGVGKQAGVEKILNRREAIRAAIGAAKPGDTVVVTGKGSEQWIHMAGGTKIPWSDRGVVEEILSGKVPVVERKEHAFFKNFEK